MVRIPITDEIRAELQTEKERTGVGSIALLGEGKAPPTYAVLERWLRGSTKTAEKEHLDFVLKKWRALPDNPYIPLTKEIQDELKRKLKNTNITFEEVAQKSGVRLTTIKSWFGASKSLKKADLERVFEVLEFAPKYPLAEEVSEWEVKAAPQYPKRKEKSPQAPVPTEFLYHLERTGITRSVLWKRMPPYCRPDVGALSSWGKGTKKTRKSWLEAAMRVLEDLPDKPPEQPKERHPTLKEIEIYIPIPEELIEDIRDYMKQPGSTYDGLIGPTPPQGLNSCES